MVESKGTRAPSLGSNASSRSSSVSQLVESISGSQIMDSDPLSLFAKQEEELMDPLSQIATEYVSGNMFCYLFRNLLFAGCNTKVQNKITRKRSCY